MSLIEYKENKERAVKAYLRGSISDEEFERLFPTESKERKQLLKKILDKQYSFKEAIFGDSFRDKTYRFIVTALLANQKWIMNNYVFKMLSASASITELIPIEAFAKKFKLSKNMELILRLILMTMMTNYMYAFYSAFTTSINQIPNLNLIFKSLIRKVINELVEEYEFQSNNFKAKTDFEKIDIGKKLTYEFIKLVFYVYDKAQALSLMRMELLGYDIPEKVISFIDNEQGSLTLAYNTLKISKNKENTSLLTDDDFKNINDNMLKVVPIATDLAIVEESSLLNPKALSSVVDIGKTVYYGIKDSSNTLENIRDSKYGSELVEIIGNKLDLIEPGLRKNLNLRHLKNTGNKINNHISNAIDDIYALADQVKYDSIEAYNYQTSYFGLLKTPDLYTYTTVEPPNPEKATVRISVDMMTPMFPLIFLFTFIYYFYSGFNKAYRYWRPTHEETGIEVLPDQRIRRSKRKSKSRSKRKY